MPVAQKKEKWKNSLAKKMLKEGVEAELITVDTDKEELFRSHAECSRWNKAQFKRNLTTLLNAFNDPNRQPNIKWGKSEAKQMLKEDIIMGFVRESSDPEEVYKMHEAYKQHKYKNFKTNLKNLLTNTRENYERMADDCDCYGHDIALLAQLRANEPPRPVPWHLSAAKNLLCADIGIGKHLTMKPKELYQDRPEYREFSLKVFRKHIYQELDKLAKKDFRWEKKQRRRRPAGKVAECVVLINAAEDAAED